MSGRTNAAALGRTELPRTGLKRYFFVAMAALILITVFVGFAPSFYLRSEPPIWQHLLG